MLRIQQRTVEIECDEYEFNGVTYLHDPSSNKVYSVEGENPFVGKKLASGSIDFNAVDSEDEGQGDMAGDLPTPISASSIGTEVFLDNPEASTLA